MIIKQISDVILSFEKMGRARETDKTYSRADISQLVRMGYTARARDIYYQNMQRGIKDYYFYSGLLSIQRFTLGDPDLRGKRFLDMTGVEIFRLPKNDNFTEILPVNSGDCTSDSTTFDVVQVEPNEAHFYLGPDFQFFKFFCVKANGLDTYNIPCCIKQLDVETTFDKKDDTVDIPMDIAFEIAFQILGWELRVKQFRTASPHDNPYATESGADLRRRMAEEAGKQTV